MIKFRDCLLFAVLMSLISTGALAQANTRDSTQADSKSGWFSDWSKEDKALTLNLGIGAAVLGWGFANWDYGSGGPRFHDEGWFDRETKEGGADKLGHFYTAYLFSHLFAGQYERWDFEGSGNPVGRPVLPGSDRPDRGGGCVQRPLRIFIPGYVVQHPGGDRRLSALVVS